MSTSRVLSRRGAALASSRRAAALGSAFAVCLLGATLMAVGHGLVGTRATVGHGRATVAQTLAGSSPAFVASHGGGGFRLRADGLSARFDAAGARFESQGGSLSLALEAVGRGARLHTLGGARLWAGANRVGYGGPGVSEWFRAGPVGIEQGFAVRSRPPGGWGPLTVALATAGLTPTPDAGGIAFTNSAGAVALSYGAPQASDASGRHLRAWLALAGGRLLIRVADAGARYPVRIDPLIQRAKVTAPDESGSGHFGFAVALSSDGTTALVGAPDDGGGTGAVWVFTRSGSGWSEQAKLTASDEVGGGHFGSSVALSSDGNSALIGAYYDNHGAGAAWVFTRSGSAWTQRAKLTPSDENGAGLFGSSVALAGDGSTALVGARANGSGVGAAWVFTGSGSAWSEQAKLTASDEVGSGAFGSSVALSADGDTALVGGPLDASDDAMTGDGRGAAWVFTRSGSAWSQQGSKLTGSGEVGDGSFGASVALSSGGDAALVGAPSDNTGVGAAWAFTRSGSAWGQQGSKLTASDELYQGEFGAGVALSSDGSTALVGGPFDNSFTGAGWVFVRSGSSWAQQGPKRTGAPEMGGARVGFGVALSSDGSTALLGGPDDNGDLGAVWAFNATSDADLALAGVPANITVTATGPDGAVVNYSTPTATDDGPETPTVSCAPPSGSTFPVGTTTVTCTALDGDDAYSPLTATFTVTVNLAPNHPLTVSSTAAVARNDANIDANSSTRWCGSGSASPCPGTPLAGFQTGVSSQEMWMAAFLSSNTCDLAGPPTLDCTGYAPNGWGVNPIPPTAVRLGEPFPLAQTYWWKAYAVGDSDTTLAVHGALQVDPPGLPSFQIPLQDPYGSTFTSKIYVNYLPLPNRPPCDPSFSRPGDVPCPNAATLSSGQTGNACSPQSPCSYTYLADGVSWHLNVLGFADPRNAPGQITNVLTIPAQCVPGPWPNCALYPSNQSVAAHPTIAPIMVSLSVDTAATSTALSSSRPTSQYGQPVTFTASVSPTPTSGGTVAFDDGGQPIAGCASQPLDPSTGEASCTTSSLAVGAHTITAGYSGALGFGPSNGGPITETIVKAPTALSAAPQLVLLPPGGAGLGTVSATLTSAGQPVAGRTVAFSAGGIKLCTALTGANGRASCSPGLLGELEILLAGSYTATFAGDGDYLGSSASAPAIALGGGLAAPATVGHARPRIARAYLSGHGTRLTIPLGHPGGQSRPHYLRGVHAGRYTLTVLLSDGRILRRTVRLGR